MISGLHNVISLLDSRPPEISIVVMLISIPTWFAASPAPDAAYMVSIIFRAILSSSALKKSTGLPGDFKAAARLVLDALWFALNSHRHEDDPKVRSAV